MAGRKALVTGGARGLGKAAAEALAKAGADVMISDILTDLGRDTAAEIARIGVKASFVAHDVTDDAAWEKAAAATVAELGGFDILINNAGIIVASPLIDMKADDIRRLNDVNILGVALGIKHAFRSMRPGGAAGKGGAVVNLSSLAALTAPAMVGVYAATKSAVDRLTRVGAVESGRFGYGVRVNCVYPSLIQTDMGRNLAQDYATLGLFKDKEAALASSAGRSHIGGLAEPRDVANAIVFLCSDEARFITGSGIPVEGGAGT
ncbi:cyclopentanol dehydrogenase [Variibacter gotjawalensis]|uniref:Cyclopentanol dehydrogenase n=1 Tax=Variibacter gotjawalensis TaxID=1333996 RepID=A0A0S3PT84_9BRAD|nr:SDR family oxidoreductase [Variibacter gotjawalensis]NIK49484.1 NAD(P)-dependent dehydrogenase (short-subunit alcohol dehydrogenase family) [Variibacter gotjawalensis]RZS51336.1 NAD(P)-dependent dehydrogenase (short-subunit alcohol dehydrogenase family) [Variibacter gotjawalensis]BAT59169.1 cyclopentanol dehydrogenase [Variibacter gotjawalensis]